MRAMLTGENTGTGSISARAANRDLALVATPELVLGALTSGLTGAEPLTGDLQSASQTSIRWLSAVDAYQRAPRRPLAIGVELATAAVCIMAAGVGVRGAGAGAAAFLVSGLLFGLWKYRSTVEAQGLSWYLKPLVPCTVAVGAAVGALPSVSVGSATDVGIVLFGVFLAVHTCLWLAVGTARRRGLALRPTLIVGLKRQVAAVEQRISMYPECGLKCEATYFRQFGDGSTPLDGHVLVDSLLAKHDVEHVVLVATDSDTDEPILTDFVGFGGGRVDLTVVVPMGRLSRSGGRIGDLCVFPVRTRPAWGSDLVKRVVDVTLALPALLLLSPVMALIALAIRLDDGGPAIFKQRRTGLDGKTFTIYKFRSMVVDAPFRTEEYLSRAVGSFSFKVFEDPRVTRVGTFIRRFSLDELPQFVNVLKGQMSLVGPRPLAVEPDEFDLRSQLRHKVRPGITGLWQVSGANALSDLEMFELDLSYVVNRSLGMDIGLMLKTIPALLVRRALY